MPVIGITGGIASGKSALTDALLRRLPAQHFDADQCARDLLVSDADIIGLLKREFSEAIMSPDGTLDRAKLRELVFGDSERRKTLEAILHPPIRQRWLEMAATVLENKSWLLVEIPLLFETAAEEHFDAVVVVACSHATQLKRLVNDRQLAPKVAEQIIAAQTNTDLKIEKATHVVWNDSIPQHLEEQATLLAAHLPSRYG